MRRPSIALFLDSPDENWLAMNLVGEMLFTEWKTSLASEVSPSAFSIDLPKLARRFPALGRETALNLDRLAGRFFVYPPRVARERRRHDFFHVVDHSYAHLVHLLPHARTGVYCHDLDAFRSVLEPHKLHRSALFRAMQRVTLRGLRAARVVFYSTKTVRAEIEAAGIIRSSRLVHAPYGIGAELTPEPREDAAANEILARLRGRSYILHVGSGVQRKRLDVLFETFARLRSRFPGLFLVQGGALVNDAQRAHIARLGIEEGVVLAGKVERSTLAAFYRHAKAVLVTSEAEGFGLPVIEGLACGATVFASDIPVLREVGDGGVIHCRVGDADDWAGLVGSFLAGRLTPPPREERLAIAAKYTWTNHARVILDAYRAIES